MRAKAATKSLAFPKSWRMFPGSLRALGLKPNTSLAGVACSLALLGTPACTTVDRQHTVEMTPQRILEDQRRQEAVIAEEARGPQIPAADYKRLIAAMKVKRERAQAEAAQYAKFQFDQKLALASASAPKLLMAGAEGLPANYRQVDYSGNRSHRQFAYANASSGGGSSRGYPNRFYQRQMQEESAVQAESEFNETARAIQAEQSEGDTPYAVPVPGKPGFVTMPPKMGGYIDVRGYSPGSYVMDPWTKSIIRVP